MIKICEFCKKEFKPNSRYGKKRAENQRHCSMVCRREHEKENYISDVDRIRRTRLDFEYHKRELRYKKNYSKINSEKRHEYYLKNKEHHLSITKKNANKRRKENISFRIACNFKVGVLRCLKLSKEGKHTFDILGYSLQDLQKHLSKQFKEGMTWGNYGSGGWHIDHKIPISAFNFKSIEDIDFKKAWALSNLQPLWARDNILKRNKLSQNFQPSFSFN